MSAFTFVLESSYVTTAVFCCIDTVTVSTPGTAFRLARTVCGQVAQYIFCTANVIVLSAAKTDDGAMRARPVTNTASLFMCILQSRKQVRREVVEAERGDHDDRRGHKHGRDKLVGKRTGTSFAINTGTLGSAIDQPIARADKAKCRRNENRLVRGKLSEVADPCAADPRARARASALRRER